MSRKDAILARAALKKFAWAYKMLRYPMAALLFIGLGLMFMGGMSDLRAEPATATTLSKGMLYLIYSYLFEKSIGMWMMLKGTLEEMQNKVDAAILWWTDEEGKKNA